MCWGGGWLFCGGPVTCGSITRCYKIAGMAEAYDVALAPQPAKDPWRLAACISAYRFCLAQCGIPGSKQGIHYNKGCQAQRFCEDKRDFKYDRGFFKPLMKPGLGQKLMWPGNRTSAKMPDWRNPLTGGMG